MTDTELRKRLAETFRMEADEHIRAMSSDLLALEKAATREEQQPIVERVFREAHNLKGAARLVGAGTIEDICQALENTLSQLKRQSIPVTRELLDGMMAQVRRLSARHFGTQPTETPLAKASPLSLPAKPAAPLLAESTSSAALPIGTGDYVRIPSGRLDSLLTGAEELVSTRLALSERTTELQRVARRLESWRAQWSRRQHDARRSLRQSETASGEDKSTATAAVVDLLDRERDFISGLQVEITRLANLTAQNFRSLQAGVDNLMSEAREVSMMPLSSMLAGFPEFVRDLASAEGKEAQFVAEGESIEVGKRILEQLKDPLVHLVRNSIDHGIELPADRTLGGKPAAATIRLRAVQQSANRVEILVSDDGNGIDIDKVRTVAEQHGLAEAEKTRSRANLLELLFESGFSTRTAATEISGRGLGLSIVREKIEQLGGTVAIESEPGAGTTFRLSIPTTLTRFRGVLVRVQERSFVVPSVYVEQVLRVKRSSIRTVQGAETIDWRGVPVALFDLGEILNVPRWAEGTPPENQPVLILASQRQRLAVAVDEVLQEQDVVMKPVGKQLSRVPFVAGATILGTGKLAPVLNGSDLLSVAERNGQARRARRIVEPKRRRVVLLVEDSITSRTLLRSVLQGAGLEVRTAVDGVEALAALRLEPVDLVVSDVQMPRLDGFELTRRIRREAAWAELPVVLVTSLASREDREQGVEAGANAYVVKSTLDQGNLLQTVWRLLA